MMILMDQVRHEEESNMCLSWCYLMSTVLDSDFLLFRFLLFIGEKRLTVNQNVERERDESGLWRKGNHNTSDATPVRTRKRMTQILH
jgi:hypothetical protein